MASPYEKETGKIIYTKNGLRIEPYTKGQCFNLERSTSVEDYPYRRRLEVTGFLISNETGNVKKKKPKTGTFISHYHDPTWLQGHFPQYQIEYEPVIRPLQLVSDISLNDDVEPREVQYQIIQGIIDREKADAWFVHLSQGLGKTLLTVYMIPYFNVKTLIMCFRRSILEQWIDVMKSKTKIPSNAIMLITSSVVLDKIEKREMDVRQYDIFMCTPGLLDSYGKKYGYHNLNHLLEVMGIGLKVYDEAHRNITNIIKINAFTNVDKTLYLSGDFSQSYNGRDQLYKHIFRGVPVLRPTSELMNTLKFTVAVVCIFDTHPSDIVKMSVYNKRGFSYYEYMKYEIKQEAYLKALYFLIDEIIKGNPNKYKILVLVNLIDNVDDLKEILDVRYGREYHVCRYHSAVPEEEKKDCMDNGELIVSTYQSFSTGIDVTHIKYVISGSLCNKIDDNQSSGRARPLPDGSDAYYFMMLDDGFAYSKKGLKNRIEYLKQTKIKAIRKLDLRGI